MLKIAIFLQTPPRGPVTFPMTKKAGISHPRLESPQTLRRAILAAPQGGVPSRRPAEQPESPPPPSRKKGTTLRWFLLPALIALTPS